MKAQSFVSRDGTVLMCIFNIQNNLSVRFDALALDITSQDQLCVNQTFHFQEFVIQTTDERLAAII